MIVALVMAMLGDVSGRMVRALTANRLGARSLSEGAAGDARGAARANGAGRICKAREKAYQNTYQRARDPPRGSRNLGRIE